MTENSNTGGTDEHALTMQATDLTAGMMMRNAREAAGLHVAALAVSMKIPVKKLEALEADRLDLLHDAVFVRALAASVCRTLKIDSAPVLQRLPLTTAPRLIPNETGINEPFRATGDAVGFSIAEVLKKPSAIAVLLLLAAGALVVLLPEGKLTDWTAELSVPAVKLSTVPGQSPVQQMPNEVPESPAMPELSATVAPTESANSKDIIVLPPLAQLAASAPPTVKASVAMAPVPTTSSAPATTPAQTTTGLVVFKARGASWVKVVDAKGVVQLNKTLSDGEVAGASGVVPLSIVIGRVDATDVEVRGKPFSLASFAKDNVARFEVK